MVSLKCYTQVISSYTVTSNANNGPNTIRSIIPLAVTDANAGKTVYVYFNASGLCQITDYLIVQNYTNGSITFLKSPLATTIQGFEVINPCSFTTPVLLSVFNTQSNFNIQGLKFSALIGFTSCTGSNGDFSISSNNNKEVNITNCEFSGNIGPVYFEQNTRFSYNNNLCTSSIGGILSINNSDTLKPTYTEIINNKMLCRDSNNTTSPAMMFFTTKFGDFNISNNMIKYYDALTLISNYSNSSHLIFNNNRLRNSTSNSAFLKTSVVLFNTNYNWHLTNNSFENNYSDLGLYLGQGIKLIEPNTLGLSPENTGNKFNKHAWINGASTPFASIPQISIFSSSSTNDGFYIVGQQISEGTIGAYGKRIFLLENKILEPLIGITPEIKPIDKGTSQFIYIFNRPYKPNITNAFLSGNVLTINYSVNDPSIFTPSNGDFRVEFFSTNTNEPEISNFLGSQLIQGTTNGLYSGTYTVNLTTLASTPVIQRIGATITSLGFAPYFDNLAIGTSEVGFSSRGDKFPNCPSVIGANYQINQNNIDGNQTKCKRITGKLLINAIDTSYTVSMNYGDGLAAQTYTPNSSGIIFNHPFSDGTYTVTATINGPGSCINTYTFVTTIICTPPPCSDCIGSFAPIPGNSYVISAWVKEKVAALDVQTTTYTNAKIKVSLLLGTNIVGSPVLISPSGLIIDGWQKIEQKFDIPTSGVTSLKLDLQSTAEANFDDIRVFPFNASMKSYVYDPTTMRLMAELDERNYATFYEYDEEGKLIRVKKETEKGIMTIKESRNSTPIK